MPWALLSQGHLQHNGGHQGCPQVLSSLAGLVGWALDIIPCLDRAHQQEPHSYWTLLPGAPLAHMAS